MFKNFYFKLFWMACICALIVLFVNISYLKLDFILRMEMFLVIFFFLSICVDAFILQFSNKYFKKKFPLTKNLGNKLKLLVISFFLTLAGLKIIAALTIYLFYQEFLKD